jgi:YD repeat-containing protein
MKTLKNLTTDKPFKGYLGFVILLIFLLALIGAAFSQNYTRPNIPGPFGTNLNSYTGNLLYQRSDLLITGRGPSLNITFSYNSGKTAKDYGFGSGWTFTYNLLYEKTNSEVIIQTGDGDEQTFTLNGTDYIPQAGIFHELVEYQPGKFLLTTKHGTKYYFDDNIHKKITKIEDRNLNAILFTYSGGNLATITTACGKTVTFSYDVNGHMTQMIDPNTTPVRTFNYEYDAYGNLIKFGDPMGNEINYSFGLWKNMSKITDARLKIVNIVYNANKAVSSIGCHEAGTLKTFVYDTTTHITTVEEFVASGNRITNYVFCRYTLTPGHKQHHKCRLRRCSGHLLQ